MIDVWFRLALSPEECTSSTPTTEDPSSFPSDGFTIHYKWTITVTAPAGTLHETFFDPVTDGSAIAADSSIGQLNPASFTDANNASATIHRVAYDSSAVTITIAPHSAITSHTLDFIAPDGSIFLSLHTDDATLDPDNNTLTWPVSDQPWHSGDKLMVRIYR
ncbi:MAG: hypothetical protein OXD46_13120 [Chloroflexi bacterium]|nr:hypothetical protein [Chloroflexota bacterium]